VRARWRPDPERAESGFIRSVGHRLRPLGSRAECGPPYEGSVGRASVPAGGNYPRRPCSVAVSARSFVVIVRAGASVSIVRARGAGAGAVASRPRTGGIGLHPLDRTPTSPARFSRGLRAAVRGERRVGSVPAGGNVPRRPCSVAVSARSFVVRACASLGCGGERVESARDTERRRTFGPFGAQAETCGTDERPGSRCGNRAVRLGLGSASFGALRRDEDRPPADRVCAYRPQAAWSTNWTSRLIVTSLPRVKPPASSAAFQFTPNSVRSILVVASAPSLTWP